MRRPEIDWLRSQNNNNYNVGEQNFSKVDLKRFPEFKQGDDPEAFLVSFEHRCHDFEVPQDHRMVILKSKVCGELAKLYVQMPVDQSRDFEKYKQLIYKQFGITSE
ncbi:hypothetical protein JRQ81_014534 [Phrynocephalus forsythii]|uniref:Uncharacterized protein n=1 Tax=Phrynocephalus forsythii TaxID=171643 RepID=A0A9Q1B3K7_9SAUR|nr:hypothetical protein JRQ81_014534 [Phrynocephalus forsythii]